jgi:CheY-like chemotaxis protein
MISDDNAAESLKHFGLLIVDDEECVCAVQKAYFKNRGFKEVLVAYDAYQAIDILGSTEDKIHVIILDIIMPNMPGFSLMEHLANNHPYHVGIVIQTGYPTPENKKTFFKYSSDKVIPIGFHIKPQKLIDLENDVLKAAKQIQIKRNRANLFRSDDKSIAEDIKKTYTRCNERKIFKPSIEADLSATLDEIIICFSNKCFIAATALAGKVLEICLKKCLSDSGVKCDANLTIGGLLKKIKELAYNGKTKYFMLNNIASVINEYRISAVHSLGEVTIPTREETILVLYGMLKAMDQTTEGTHEQQRSCINSSQKSSPVPKTATGSF